MNQVEVIQPDKIVNIQVSGAFYARIHQLMYYFASKKSPEEFAKLLSEMSSREPLDNDEYHLLTTLCLLKEIEDKGREQKLTEMVDIPKPSESSEVDGEQIT